MLLDLYLLARANAATALGGSDSAGAERLGPAPSAPSNRGWFFVALEEEELLLLTAALAKGRTRRH